MISIPFFIAVIFGVIILLITWWFKKISLPLTVRILPGVLTVIIAIVLFYVSFVNIRGFEGAVYGIFSSF